MGNTRIIESYERLVDEPMVGYMDLLLASSSFFGISLATAAPVRASAPATNDVKRILMEDKLTLEV
jgi:hypothetical protein